MAKFLSGLAIFLFALAPLMAQRGNNSELKIKEIMKGDEFVGHRPSSPYWSTDSKTLYFEWNPEGAHSDSLYAYDLASKQTRKVGFIQAHALPAPRIVYNREKTLGVYAKNGDLFLLDPKTYGATPITRTADRESDPQFSHNGERIAYTKGGELYTWEIASGLTEQLTRFVKAKDKEPKRDSKDQWLYQDQLELFEVLQERKAKKDAEKKIETALEALRPLELETGGKN